MDKNSRVVFESPNNSADLSIENYVLNFPELQEFLGEEVEEYGGEIYTNATVTESLTDNGKISGLEYLDSEGNSRELSANLVVDATGADAIMTSELGFFDRNEGQRGIGLEYEARGNYEPEDAMVFSFDHKDAPGGYAWTFPAGENTFKAGICSVDDFRELNGDDRSIKKMVDDWVEDPRWNVDEIVEQHAGEVVSGTSIHQRATDGFMAIGDSVSSINPLFGEGIRPAMESADMAAEVALEALENRDLSEQKLREYENTWNQQKGKKWRNQRIVGELLYDFNEKQQDEFIQRADQLSEEKVEDLRKYDLSLIDLAKIYPFDTKDIKKVPTLARHFL